MTVLHANDVASQIDRPLALRVAGDAMADLRATNEALRRRDPALAEPAAAGPWLAEVRRQIRQAAGGEEIAAAAHQVRRIQVGLARKPGQAAPAVLVTLAGTIRRSSYGTSDTRALRTSAASPWSQTFEMAAGDTRYRIVAQRSAADHAGSAAPRATSPIEVRLAPTGPDSVPQGGRFGFRVTLHNPTDTGAGSRVELSLAGPDGVTVPFAAEEKLVPGRGDATLTSAVVPATWFEQLGDYEIAARVDGRAAAERLRFTVTRPPVEVPRFDDVTDDAGVRTTVPAPACGTFSSGAAWGDADGDGNLDLFVTRLGKPARLYMGDGKGRFSEQAARRGADVRFATGAAFADYDGDGRADLFVARAGHASLLLRNTGGRFTDVTRRAGLAVDANASGGAWADVDGDGDLDLYVANYVTCVGSWDTGLDELSKVRYSAGRLLRNDGDGRFSDVTRRLHGKTRGAAFTAAWFDADGDGRPDLYLANDFVGQRPDSNRLWRNTGDGRLRDVSEASGTALFMNTMGIGVGDVDRDGRLDLALSNIGGNRLLRNAGRGRFTDVAGAFGVARPWQRTGRPSVTWGVGFADLNLDGWDDLLFAAGNISKRADGGLGPQPDQLFVGDGTGRRMLDLSAPSGVTDAGDTKGAAFADYDRDGRMDVFLVDQGGTGRLLHNVTPRGDTHWLEVDPRACGVRVVVHIDGQRPMTDEVACGGTSVGSGNQAVAHFGLGRATRVDRLEVRWGTAAHDPAPRRRRRPAHDREVAVEPRGDPCSRSSGSHVSPRGWPTPTPGAIGPRCTGRWCASSSIPRYVQSHVTGPLPSLAGVSDDTTHFDGDSAGWWPDEEAFRETMGSPEWHALVVDGDNVFDMPWTDSMSAQVVEHTIVEGPSTPYKVAWVVKFKEGMDRDEASAYWREHHGPIVARRRHRSLRPEPRGEVRGRRWQRHRAADLRRLLGVLVPRRGRVPRRAAHAGVGPPARGRRERVRHVRHVGRRAARARRQERAGGPARLTPAHAAGVAASSSTPARSFSSSAPSCSASSAVRCDRRRLSWRIATPRSRSNNAIPSSVSSTRCTRRLESSRQRRTRP